MKDWINNMLKGNFIEELGIELVSYKKNSNVILKMEAEIGRASCRERV